MSASREQEQLDASRLKARSWPIPVVRGCSRKPSVEKMTVMRKSAMQQISPTGRFLIARPAGTNTLLSLGPHPVNGRSVTLAAVGRHIHEIAPVGPPALVNSQRRTPSRPGGGMRPETSLFLSSTGLSGYLAQYPIQPEKKFGPAPWGG